MSPRLVPTSTTSAFSQNILLFRDCPSDSSVRLPITFHTSDPFPYSQYGTESLGSHHALPIRGTSEPISADIPGSTPPTGVMRNGISKAQIGTPATPAPAVTASYCFSLKNSHLLFRGESFRYPQGIRCVWTHSIRAEINSLCQPLDARVISQSTRLQTAGKKFEVRSGYVCTSQTAKKPPV